MRQLLNEMLRMTEDDMLDAPMAPEAEVPPAEEAPAANAVTPEIIAQLKADMPELAEIDPVVLEKGLNAEAEHLQTVGGEWSKVAQIVLDHIKEFPGKDYYAALEQMEHELQETPEEEEAEHAEGGEEAAGETPAGEAPVESAIPKVDDVKKAEDKKEDAAEVAKKSEEADKKEEEKEKKA